MLSGRLLPARVSEEHKSGYRLLSANGALQAELSGRLRYLATGPEELPAVGDWVVVDPRLEGERATIQHLLGLDHERLTFRYQGRDFRLTDVSGNVVQAMLA